MLPPTFDLDQALADVHWMVQEIGPRLAGSPAAAAAAAGVGARLAAAGWSPVEVGHPGNLVACRGPGTRLFLAHTDSVPLTPGAVDNAAGVAALLALARSSEATDLCLGFPVAEELGFVGSKAFAASLDSPDRGQPGGWRPGPAPLALVVALDLVGHGRLSVTGLGPAHGAASMRWLNDATDGGLASPYAYRVVSHALPHMERSDHGPFAARGVLSIQLLGRNQDGIFGAYHQPEDTEVSPVALTELVAALEGIATAPGDPPAPRTSPDPAAWIGNLIVPSWIVWTGLAAGIGSGLVDLRKGRGLPGQLIRGLVVGLLAWVLMLSLTQFGWAPPTQAEDTAHRVMDIASTGWWAMAPLAVGGSALAWGLARWRLSSSGSAPLATALMALVLAAWHPLLGLPWALAALAARLHPLFAAAPLVYLLRPSVLRELAFHGLLNPAMWGVIWLLAWPAFGRYPSKR